MILAALNDYYQRLSRDPESGVPQQGYRYEQISFAIVLDTKGRVVDLNDLREVEGKKVRPARLQVPLIEKSSEIKPKFLWDNTSYALGVSARSKRIKAEHEAFKSFHRQALANTDDPALRAFLAFLDSWTVPQFQESPLFRLHGEHMLDTSLVFRLDGDRRYLHERPAAREVWSHLQEKDGKAEAKMCLVTGKSASIARLHPKIRGVNGAQSSGASLVSFNLDAFTSYGKMQGENAPVSEQAAFAYTTALNHLLRRDERNRQRTQIGDTSVVFWAQGSTRDEAVEAEDVLVLMLGAGETDEQATGRLHDLLRQISQMRPMRELGGHLRDDTGIFVLGLAPNASRLSVRFWETGTLATFVRRLAEHYFDLELDPPAWRHPPSPSVLALQTAPIRKDKANAEDVSPLLAGELARAILAGTRYPRSLLANLVMRFRSDGQITPLRVALCRGVLARDARLDGRHGESTNKGVPPVGLDLSNNDPGYLLGRLFSALESVQLAALGKDVNATIRDRYYGAASATPASIFPVLLRNAQNHLGKLRKEKPGLAVNLEKEIGQIIDALPSTLPRSLPIDEQGRFAIGYYHQSRARFSRNTAQRVTDIELEGVTE